MNYLATKRTAALAGMIGWVLVARGVATGSHLRPGVDEALERVARSVATAHDSKVDPAKRAEALAASIAERSRVIDEAPNDDRAPTWMLDQVEALLEQAGLDGAELSVLFGAPTEAQGRRMHDVSIACARLIQRAGEAARLSVSKLEDQLFASRANDAEAKRLAAEIEPKMKRLVDVEQSWRLPMLAARVSLVENSGATEAAVRRAAELTGIFTDEARPPSAEGERALGLIKAIAAIMKGQRSEAWDVLSPLRTSIGPNDALSDRLTLGLLRCAPTEEDVDRLVREASAKRSPGAAIEMVYAETISRAYEPFAPDEVENRDAARAKALGPMEVIARRELGASGDLQSHSALLEKLAKLMEPPSMWARPSAAALPPGIALARGAWLRAHPSSDEVRKEADRLLARVADQPDGAELKCAALAAMESAEADVRIIKECPDAPATRAAAGRALRSTELTMERTTAPRAERESACVTHLDVLRIAVDKRWAVDAGQDRGYRLRFAQVVTTDLAPRSAELIEQSVALLRPAFADAEPGTKRVIEQAYDALVKRAINLVDTKSVEPGPASRMFTALAGWGQERGFGSSAIASLRVASALMDRGDAAGALAALKGDETRLTDADRIAWRVIKGRAQRASGDGASAFATLRLVADELDRTPSPKPAVFWEVWAEMLEILQSQNAQGERTATIRLQINKLEIIDKSLGGGANAERIRAVRAKLDTK